MPLLDHFRPPVEDDYPWESFHATWATRIADRLNDEWLSGDFIAAELTTIGRFEIDIASLERPGRDRAPPEDGPGGTATLTRTYAAPVPAAVVPASYPSSVGVRVFSTVGGRRLVAAIELVSPGNKDRPESRSAFAAKCAALLHQGVALVVIDIVTRSRADLHAEVMRLLAAGETAPLPKPEELYAVAYRPLVRDDQPEIEVWTEAFDLGAPLPTMPLRLTGDIVVPVEFEATYAEACRRRRLI